MPEVVSDASQLASSDLSLCKQLGKVIGGGLPVGAYGGRRDIMQMVAPAGEPLLLFARCAKSLQPSLRV